MKVKINTHGGPLPEVHGDWIDLFTAEEVTMRSGEYKEISLGVSMELPDGYYAKVLPRSSTFKKYGLVMVNSMGIIDHDYCGDEDVWHFVAYSTQYTKIPKGTRIAQFCIEKCGEHVEWDQVEKLGNKNRGGIGSTGTN